MSWPFSGVGFDQAVFEGGEEITSFFEIDGAGDVKELFVGVARQLDLQADGRLGVGGDGFS